MKKPMIIISAIIAILVIALSVYFIFIKDKSEPVDNPGSVHTPTQAPTLEPSPTVTPLPEESTNEINLFPATKQVDGTTKYGFIDRTGAFAIEPIYDFASDFNEGVAIVKEGEKQKVINSTGAVIFENNDIIQSFHNGIAAYMNIKEDTFLYGYIDLKGQVIIEPSFTFAGSFNEDGMAYVALPGGKSYQLIDKTGKALESYEVDLGNSYAYSFEDGYLLYNDPDTLRYGVKKLDGTQILEANYSDIAYLGHDLFAVKSPDIEPYEAMFDPAAIMNAQGEQLTEYTLFDVQHFYGDYSSASNDTYVFFLDTNGQEVTSLPSYDGSGKLTLIDDIVKTELEGDLAYYHLDNTVLWQEDTTTYLDLGIAIKELKFKPLRSVMVRYPQVEGLADPAVQKEINEQIETLFTESRANITLEDGLSVDDSYGVSLTKNLLIISMSGYDYYEGAAHGMPLSEHYFIDITTGEFYNLKDLFIKGSDYMSVIDDFISTEISEANPEESMFFPDSFTGIAGAQHFYLTEGGIVLYFYPYEIAPYAAGFPEFEISFEELKDFINMDGPFWKSFH